MTALVILFPAAFVNITELLASKLPAKVGIHRYNTANRGAQTLFHLQSTSRLQTNVVPVTTTQHKAAPKTIPIVHSALKIYFNSDLHCRKQEALLPLPL